MDEKRLFKAALLLAVAVAAITLAAVFLGSRLGVGGTAATGADPVREIVTSTAEAPANDTPKNDGILITGFDVMRLQAGTYTQACDLLFNPAANDCSIVFSLYLPDGTIFYQSAPVDPGQRLETLEIDRKLTAGTYEGCRMVYDCYDLRTEQPLNGAEITFTLEVVQ